MYTSPDDERVIREIQRQCDEVDWKLGRRDAESVCYWSDELPGSPVIGFKRVSYVDEADLDEIARWHGEGIIDIWAYTSKDTYARGQHLELRHESDALYHSVVRTLFDLPFGMTGREYLHHLYKKRVDDRTWVIAYRTPDDARRFPPPRQGYLRCRIYNSGDRFQRGEDGRIRVEHLMTYTLEGWVTPWMADTLFRQAHINAYFQEGKAVKEIFDHTSPDVSGSYPAQFSMYVGRPRMCADTLLAGMAQALDDDRIAWRTVHEGDELRVATAPAPYCPLIALRVDMVCDAAVAQLSATLGEDLIAYLPRWDDDFVTGEMTDIEDQDDRWLVRSVHSSHGLLARREFTYCVARARTAQHGVLIAYQSVLSYDITVPKGTVRGHYFPSAWRLSPEADGRTRLTWMSVAEYNGRISRKRQNSASFVARMVEAMTRKASELRELLKGSHATRPDAG